jgi:hypothetical protein
MFATGSVAVNAEVAWNPVPNAPVEELNGNAVIPVWLAAYRNPDAGCGGGISFPEPPHPNRTDTKTIARHPLAEVKNNLHPCLTPSPTNPITHVADVNVSNNAGTVKHFLTLFSVECALVLDRTCFLVGLPVSKTTLQPSPRVTSMALTSWLDATSSWRTLSIRDHVRFPAYESATPADGQVRPKTWFQHPRLSISANLVRLSCTRLPLERALSSFF